MASHNRDMLWKVVDSACVPDMRLRGSPAPCVQVDLGRGFVVFKDIVGRAQILLIPTRRVTGIEDPQLLSPAGPNYWEAAWEARGSFEQRLGLQVPRETIGMAINSAHDRTQDQLHIHVDCLRPDVAAVLRMHGGGIGWRWSELSAPLAGRRYRAMRVMGEDLGSRDPFKLLAGGDPLARADMGQQTLVVAGYRSAHGKPGFLLLSHRADPAAGDRAHGEDLLDHHCTALLQGGNALIHHSIEKDLGSGLRILDSDELWSGLLIERSLLVFRLRVLVILSPGKRSGPFFAGPCPGGMCVA